MTDNPMIALRHHNADYGFDGSFHTVSPRVQAVIVGVGSAALLALAGLSKAKDNRLIAALMATLGTGIIATAGLYLHTTRIGKFAVWAEILNGLQLRGDETVLDLGCGRGAVLLAAAKLLPRGRAMGVDLWRADQTDNSPQPTLANAALENVAERVEVQTADIADLPYDDNSVDVVVASLAIHNIRSRTARQQAINEAARVLRPGGRLVIADLWATRQHERHLCELGWENIARRNLGWRMWWGGPWFPTHLVTATKPRMVRLTGAPCSPS